VHYLSAERDLVPSDEPASGHGLLVLGAPSYDATSLFASLRKKEGPGPPPQIPPATPDRAPRAACGDFATVRFGALPATGKESRDVARLWEKHDPTGARELRDAAASETELKGAAPGRR